MFGIGFLTKTAAKSIEEIKRLNLLSLSLAVVRPLVGRLESAPIEMRRLPDRDIAP